MRVLIFDNSYDGRLFPRSGGDNVHAFEFASHLPEQHRCRILKWGFLSSSTKGKAAGIPIELLAIPSFFRNPLFSFLLFFYLTFNLVLRILRFRPDVLIAYKVYPNGLPAVFASFLTGKKCFIRASGSDLYERPRNLLSRILVRVAVSNSSGILCISDWMMRVCSLFKGIALRVYTGVDFKAFKFRPKPFSSQLSVLYLGRIEPQKDIPALKEIVLGLDPRLFKVTIVGEGALSGSLRSALKGKANFIDSVPHSKVPELLSQFHILLLPTSYEGLPNVILEAFASGTMVLCSDVPGNREIIRNSKTGFLCRTPADFLNTLYSLDRKNYLRVVQDARKGVRSFTWEEYASSFLPVSS